MADTLIHALARFVYGLRLDGCEPALGQAKALLLDALAATAGGMDSDAVAGVRKALGGTLPPGPARLFGEAAGVAPAAAAFIHGAALRYLDIMDYDVSVDVSHPSECVPAVLACGQAARAGGREVLDCLAAGYRVTQALTDTVPLHSVGLHHVGHAAIVVPLVVSRLRGLDVQTAAAAASISAARFLVPEGFAKGHLASVKALAYPLLARQAIEAVDLAAAGFAGSPGVVEELLEILRERFGAAVSGEALLDAMHGADLGRVQVKAYPAQYSLQGLIAGAAQAAGREPDLWRQVERIEIHSSARSLERTADAAKFKPKSREAADHSMPFCIAMALMEGRMEEDQLERGRWRDADVLALMARMEPHPLPGNLGFRTGAQSLVLHLAGGARRTLDCSYPPAGARVWDVALRKLRRYGEGKVDVEVIAARIAGMEALADVSDLW